MKTGLINEKRKGYTISAQEQKTCFNSGRATDISAKLQTLSLLESKNKWVDQIPASENGEVDADLSKSAISSIRNQNSGK